MSLNTRPSGHPFSAKFLNRKKEFATSRPIYNSTWLNSETLTADHTLSTTDSGRAIFVDTSSGAVTLTLPATAIGVNFFIVVKTTSTNDLNLSPNASDKIVGLASAGTDDKDLILANPTAGDYVKLMADGVDGYYVVEASGTFTRES